MTNINNIFDFSIEAAEDTPRAEAIVLS